MLATYHLFLENTCGFYYQLLQSICYRYNSPLPAFLTPEEIGLCRRPVGSATAGVASVREVGHECLMRMGDASRYKGEYSLAKKYYLQVRTMFFYYFFLYRGHLEEVPIRLTHVISNLRLAATFHQSLLWPLFQVPVFYFKIILLFTFLVRHMHFVLEEVFSLISWE